MKYNDFDTKLKDMLNAASSDVTAPDDMLDRIRTVQKEKFIRRQIL